jgi:hypothetical protein
MARKRYTPEQIIGMLQEAEVRLAPPKERDKKRYARKHLTSDPAIDH